jgi:hypothetical protein
LCAPYPDFRRLFRPHQGDICSVKRRSLATPVGFINEFGKHKIPNIFVASTFVSVVDCSKLPALRRPIAPRRARASDPKHTVYETLVSPTFTPPPVPRFSLRIASILLHCASEISCRFCQLSISASIFCVLVDSTPQI